MTQEEVRRRAVVALNKRILERALDGLQERLDKIKNDYREECEKRSRQGYKLKSVNNLKRK